MDLVLKLAIEILNFIIDFLDKSYGKSRYKLIAKHLNPRITYLVRRQTNLTSRKNVCIASSAIARLGENKRLTVYTVDRPGHHAEIFPVITKHFSGREPKGVLEQGFMTNHGYFVDRVLGLEIAKKANQIKLKHGNDNLLFSEDMWGLTSENEIFRNFYLKNYRSKVSILLRKVRVWLNSKIKETNV